MKIRTVGAELFSANGQTATTNLLVAFRNFANEPKKNHFFVPKLTTPPPNHFREVFKFPALYIWNRRTVNHPSVIL